ncbi:histidine phosphotransferase ChpT [Roseovarius sp. MBR-51]
MPQHSQPLAALIASRICHDLVSPLGAISNGLELLHLSGVPQSPELTLITSSATNATARIRFFRLAFGQADEGQSIHAKDLCDILTAVHVEGRITLDLRLSDDIPHPMAQALLLTILCVEQAMPYGGLLHVSRLNDRWHITAISGRLNPDLTLWAALSGSEKWPEVSASQVHFLILFQCLATRSSRVDTTLSDTEFRVSL